MVDWKRIGPFVAVALIALGGGTLVVQHLLGGMRLMVDDDKTRYYLQDESAGWDLVGVEEHRLFSGSKKLNRMAKDISLVNWTDTSLSRFYIQRSTPYYRQRARTVDTYVFDGFGSDVRYFPVEHYVDIYNASGLIFVWQVKNIPYSGESMSLLDRQRMEFLGGKLVAEWNDFNYYAAVFSSSKTLRVKYRIRNNHTRLWFRYFDPDVPEAPNETVVWDDNCYNETYSKNVSVFSHWNSSFWNETNQSWFNSSPVYNLTVIDYNLTVCEPFFWYNQTKVDFLAQEYNCRNDNCSGNDSIICDSMIDGNGDGFCEADGREHCCVINCSSFVVSCTSHGGWNSNVARLVVS